MVCAMSETKDNEWKSHDEIAINLHTRYKTSVGVTHALAEEERLLQVVRKEYTLRVHGAATRTRGDRGRTPGTAGAVTAAVDVGTAGG